MCNQKTAYELRISDWSSDVCSSDLFAVPACCQARGALLPHHFTLATRPEGPFGGLLSVALSVGSRRPGVTWHRALWSPDFPRHPFGCRDCLADSAKALVSRSPARHRRTVAVQRPAWTPIRGGCGRAHCCRFCGI